jgi:Zn finger protein HypA/HybF involved in hydrogenase expression
MKCKNCKNEIKANEKTEQGYCSKCLARVGIAKGAIRK